MLRDRRGESCPLPACAIENRKVNDEKREMPKPSGETWFVYLLRCADGSLYTGITTDLSRRCQQHNAGTASRYARSRRPTQLVYSEACSSRSLALKREAAIKTLSRRQKETLIRFAS
jgi:predicted GIY-YIG superfamily endonuclease